jgi:hypothetical protein
MHTTRTLAARQQCNRSGCSLATGITSSLLTALPLLYCPALCRRPLALVQAPPLAQSVPLVVGQVAAEVH